MTTPERELKVRGWGEGLLGYAHCQHCYGCPNPILYTLNRDGSHAKPCSACNRSWAQQVQS